jgi:hypothetical protein
MMVRCFMEKLVWATFAGATESRGKNSHMEGVTQIHTTVQNRDVDHRKDKSIVDHLRIRATALMNTRPTPGLQVGPSGRRS